MDVFRQRLEDEYNANIIITAPTVPYKGQSMQRIVLVLASTYVCTLVIYRDRTEIVSNPTDFPDVTDPASKFREVHEPVVKAAIIVPDGLQVIFNSPN